MTTTTDVPHARLIIVALVSLTVSAGCAGARVQVTAERSRYAISMSPAIRDQTGRLHDVYSLQRVGTLNAGKTRVGFLYSGLTPLSRYDISEEVNEQVAAAGGEAVVGLTVSVSENCEILNGFPILNILPIWPGCVPITVTGVIVRRGAGPPPPRAGP